MLCQRLNQGQAFAMLVERQWLVATFGQSIFSGFAQLEAR